MSSLSCFWEKALPQCHDVSVQPELVGKAGVHSRQLAERIMLAERGAKIPAGSDAMTTRPRVTTAQTGLALMNSFEKTFKGATLLDYRGETYNAPCYFFGDTRIFNPAKKCLQIIRGGMTGAKDVVAKSLMRYPGLSFRKNAHRSGG